VLAPPGVVMVASAEVPRNAERAQSEGRAKSEECGIHRKQRGQGQYKGWGPTPSFAAAGTLIPARIATTLLHQRLQWVTTLLYPTASERERSACSRYALLGTRRAGGGRRPGD
jgi:hypothetical protein